MTGAARAAGERLEVAALGGDELLEFAPGGSVGEPGVRGRARGECGDWLAEIEGEVDEVGGPWPSKGVETFLNFEGVADSAAERFGHRGETRVRGDAHCRADLDHGSVRVPLRRRASS